MSGSLQPHGLQHSRLLCSSLSPRVFSNSCPLSQWCHSTILSSVTRFSSCPQSFPGSESFSVSQLFASGDQSIGASASVLPMNVQGWFPWALFESMKLVNQGTRCFSQKSKNTMNLFKLQVLHLKCWSNFAGWDLGFIVLYSIDHIIILKSEMSKIIKI